MKKLIALILVSICSLSLVGCSSEIIFDITSTSKIELRSGSDGTTVEITNREDIKRITDNISALKFSEEGSSKDHSGWSYWLKWYDSENNLIEEIVVMSEKQINYKDYFYTCMEADHEIDISFFDALLGS